MAERTVFDEPFSEGKNGRTYLVPCLASHAPIDLVVIMLGTNDLKEVYRSTPSMIASGMTSLVRICRQSEAGPDARPPAVLVIAPAPVGPITQVAALWGFGEGERKSREVAQMYRLLAEREGVQFLDGGSVASVDPAEGVHLTAAAHTALAAAVAARIGEWFQTEARQPAAADTEGPARGQSGMVRWISSSADGARRQRWARLSLDIGTRAA